MHSSEPVKSLAIPSDPSELNPGFLNAVLAELHPGISIQDARVLKIKSYGEADNRSSVSTSMQVSLDVKYACKTALPTRLFAKLSLPEGTKTAHPSLQALFRNEVLFYRKLRTEIQVESPLVLGAHYDPQGNRFIILMEDLETRGFRINNFLNDDNIPVLKSLLDNLARLHAYFWQTPRFDTDLNWVENQLSGGVEELLDGAIYDHILKELAREKYKREFIDELGATASELHAGLKAIKRHQATLPQTLLHGDAHLGNSYVLPDGGGGLLDYQLTARGFAMHDVGYLIHSALSVKGRRKHEHDLLQYYRDCLSAHGVDNPPGLDDFWVEYRRSALYTFYMGWLPAPRENYGLEACVLANYRAKTACIDLKCMELIP